jgi:hypothetical protein
MEHGMQKARLQCAMTWIAACFLPVFALGFWMSHDLLMPQADASDFMGSAYHLYNKWLHNGFLDFLTSLYTNRGWRPIAFHLLALPVLMLTHGSIEATIFIVLSALMAVTCVYLYLLARLLTDRVPALLIANVIGLLPLVQMPIGMIFFAESGFLPAVLAALYHAVRSENFTRRGHSVCFTVACVAAVWVRPVEAVLQLGPVIAYVLCHGVRRKEISWAQLGNLAIALGFGLALTAGWSGIDKPFFKAHPWNDTKPRQMLFTLDALRVCVYSASIIALLSLVMMGRRQWKTGQASYLLPACYAILGGALFWFAPYFMELLEWIYVSNFGFVAAAAAGTGTKVGFLFHKSLLHSLSRYFFYFGKIPLSVFALAALLRYRRAAAIWRQPAAIFLALMIPLILVLSFITVQDSARKFIILLPALMLLLGAVATQPGKLRPLILCLFSALLLMQFYALTLNALGKASSPFWRKNILALMPPPLNIHPNPYRQVNAFLQQMTDTYHFKSIAYPNNPDDGGFDPFALLFLSHLNPNGYALTLPMPPQSMMNAEPLQWFRTRTDFDAMVLTNEWGDMALSDKDAAEYRARMNGPHASFNMKLALEMLAEYKAGHFEAMGIRKLKCLEVASISRSFCVFALPPPKTP